MANNSQKRRFVIHKHTRGNDVHWDLMIEWGDVLKTWRLDNPPEKLATEKTKATSIFDHDKKFLSYQGPVNNDTGRVEIVDQGTCTIESDDGKILRVAFTGKILMKKLILEGQK
jgi:hypothetical protein